MCTAFIYRAGQSALFGRNMDIDVSFGEQVVVTPAGYELHLKNGGAFRTGHAMIGMAREAAGFPLYAEAANDSGLVMAGLNFPGAAAYHPARPDKENITPYEFTPWILGQASTADEAHSLLENVSVLGVPFAEGMPLSPLHFFIGDKKRSFVAEPRENGLCLYDDPFDVLTNNPPFPYHEWNMRNYRRLSPCNGGSLFGGGLELPAYAQGMGSIGLPGDPSSASRFIRTAFGLANSPESRTPDEAVAQVFHILDSVAMVEGTVATETGTLDITRYSCCIDLADGAFMYKTYGNSRITRIRMTNESVSAASLTICSLRLEQDIYDE